MTLLWLNSALLALASLVVVPLVAHLFAKARPRELPFPSLQWLRQAQHRTARVRKPKDWLLLVLRTLALAALVAAFLQPLLFRGAHLAAASARKTVVVVVDRSASMNVVESGRSRLAKATALAEEVLKSAGSQALVNAVLLDADPDAIFPDPGVNRAALVARLQRLQASYESGDVANALRLAMEQLGRGEGGKELHVISDFQASAWREVDFGIPPNVKLYKISTSALPASNAAVASLIIQPERPVTGTDMRVLARVRNFSAEESKTTLQLATGETRQSRAVTVPPWGESVAEFRVACGAPGLQAVTAALPEDAYPADDRRIALAEVRESWRVETDGDAGDASLMMWRRALGALGWLRLDAPSGPPPDVILSVRGDPTRAAELREAAGRGAVVICQPHEAWSGTPWMALWGAGAQEAGLSLEERDREKDQPWTLQTVRDDSEVWGLFRNGEFGDPAAGSLWRRMRLPTVDPDAVLLRFTDGVPALAAQRVGRGWVIVWNIDLDEAAGDAVQHPSLLVVLGELLIHHSESGGTSARTRVFGPHQVLSWQPQTLLAADQIRLQDEASAELPFLVDEKATPPRIRSREPLPPGLYRWMVDGQVLEQAVVAFPSDQESDLRHLDPASLPAGESISLDATAALVAQRDGEPMWPWCVGAAMLFLTLEGLLARVRRRESVEPVAAGGAA